VPSRGMGTLQHAMSRTHLPTVCVIGAGIAGASTAYALAQAGWRVRVLDALAGPAGGASGANGAQLSYQYVEPLATPAALGHLPLWLMRSGSPVRWRPQARWSHAAWLARFVAACQPHCVRQTTGELLALAEHSRQVLHGWLQQNPPWRDELGWRAAGKLVLYRQAAQRKAAQRQLALQQAFGARQQCVDTTECLAIEPALHGGPPPAFGVWTPGEEVIDAARLTRALLQASQAQCLWMHDVRGARGSGDQLRAVTGVDAHGQGFECAADAFVLAPGAGAAVLGRALGLALPVEPIKGYSVSLPLRDAARAPSVSVTDTDRKMVFARLSQAGEPDRLRIAGFADIVGHDLQVAPERIQALIQAAHAVFAGACDDDDAQPWAGLRPATPTGRPLLGATRWNNLWLNTGHGALGLTLAAGCAQRLAQALQRPAPRGERVAIASRPVVPQ
jgi:D-amino-acid dehydrogenase